MTTLLDESQRELTLRDLHLFIFLLVYLFTWTKFICYSGSLPIELIKERKCTSLKESRVFDRSFI